MSFNNERLLEFLNAEFPGKIDRQEESYSLLTIHINCSDLIEVIEKLKNTPEFDFNYLTDLCGIHNPTQEGKELGVVYHLHSLRNNVRVRIKTFMPIAIPNCPTLTGLYVGANWMERETFDFYGIIFEGHPDLRRILNMDSMDYFPLRKQYALEDETREDKDDGFFGR